jgi:hypothetical protein
MAELLTIPDGEIIEKIEVALNNDFTIMARETE